MKLKLNKKSIVDNFINPVSKLTDRCVINVTKDLIYTLTSNEDGIIQKNIVNVDKINKLTFDTNFELTNNKVNEILKGSTFTSETNKIYFYTKDSEVYAELSDRKIQNTDSITFSIADSYTGTDLKTVLPINLEVIRLFSGVSFNTLKVKINTKLKVLMFELNTGGCLMRYMISALVK